jgi:hypothetical protein
VQTENKTVPIVQHNIPYRQSLINTVTQLQADLKTNMDKNDAIIAVLDKYRNDPKHKRDNWQDEVIEQDLVDAGEHLDRRWRV